MDTLAAWLLFPAALVLLSLGCGLLLGRAAARRLPGALLVPAGLALLIALVNLITFSEALAGVTLPLLAVVALVGLVLGRRRLRPGAVDPWAAAAAIGVFAVFGAPAMLSGEPTFSGSLVLPDTANQLALAERVAEAGPEFESLPPSSHRFTLAKYLGTQYPVAAQATLGVFAPLGFQEIAWLYQPFLSFLAAMTALALYGLLSAWIARRPLRAGAAFLAAQPALAVSFALQGSIKETAAATTYYLLVALVSVAVTERWGARAFVPAAVVAAAMIGALGPAALAYVGPLALVLGAPWAIRTYRARRRSEVMWGMAAVAAGAVLLVPVLSGASVAYEVNSATLLASQDLGNLPAPLDVGQATGVWLGTDFRYPPDPNPSLSFALIGIVAVSALLGVGWAVRRRAFGPLLAIVITGGMSLYLLRRGSPYADAKVLMLLAPAVLLAGVLGVAALGGVGRRFEAVALAAILGAAVLGSNAMAYHGAQNAPHDRYDELLEINKRYSGRGPALFTEYDEFASYLLRDVRPFAMPEYPVEFLDANPARNPNGLADLDHRPSVKTPLEVDDLESDFVQSVPMIVLRRSPTVSRPPVNFRRVFAGRYYEVWRRDTGPGAREVLAHLPLGGDVFSPGGIPGCGEVREMAAHARRAGGELAYVTRPGLLTADPTNGEIPTGWAEFSAYPRALVPTGQGEIERRVNVADGGPTRLWLEGSFARGLSVEIDGRDVGEVAYELGNPGQFLPVGVVDLEPGVHRVRLLRGGGDLRPGNGGGSQGSFVHVGALVFSPEDNERRTVRTVTPRDAAMELCGRRLDWIEVVAPAGS